MSAGSFPPSPLPPDINRGYIYITTMAVFLAISLFLIVLRTWVRARITRSMGWDDYLILVAFLFAVINQALSYASVKFGLGRHVYYLHPQDAMRAAELNYIAQIFYVITFYFVKVSLAAFLLRLGPSKICQWITWLCIFLLTASNGEAVIVELAQCRPLRKVWNPTLPGSCWSTRPLLDSAYGLSAVAIFTDVIYLLIPMYTMWNVQMKSTTKYAIWGLLGLGMISTGCSITVFFFIPLLGDQDVTFATVNVACIKFAELNSAFIVACLPPLRPLFKKLKKGLTTDQSSHTAGTYGSRQQSGKPPGIYRKLSRETHPGKDSILRTDDISMTWIATTDEGPTQGQYHVPDINGNSNQVRAWPAV